jgi:hypothetical protein
VSVIHPPHLGQLDIFEVIAYLDIAGVRFGGVGVERVMRKTTRLSGRVSAVTRVSFATCCIQ